jgi:hypothetical protein
LYAADRFADCSFIVSGLKINFPSRHQFERDGDGLAPAASRPKRWSFSSDFFLEAGNLPDLR